MRIVSARVELVCLWKVGPLHDVYTDFYRDLAFKAISTPLKHQKIIAFECFRNFRATARSCNATDQSRACKIRIFFRLLQLFIQLRGSGTGSNYAVRGLDQKVYTSVEATANSPPKGQRQHKDPNNYQKRTLFDYF